jgi:myo-inositol-1(or 4)-monophosphatase
MDVPAMQEALREAGTKVKAVLGSLDDWGLAGTRPGQYRSDLAADEVALSVLQAAGLSVLSEESGMTGEGPLVAVLDPVDGSTNAACGIPWYATSICVVDESGPLLALVVNQAIGTTYEAVRDGGAFRDGHRIGPSAVTELSDSMLGLAGYPRRYLGWRQYRALGAAALDLCAVAEGMLDGYLDCSHSGHGVWDYLAAQLVCAEAGAVVGDARGRELLSLDHAQRRSPVAAATPQLFAELMEALSGQVGLRGDGRDSRA